MPFNLAHQLLISWGAIPDPAIARWEIFAFRGDVPPDQRDTPGECVGHACATARSATIELEEGEYVIQVVPRSIGGQLGLWQRMMSRRVMVGQTPAGPVGAPRNPAAGVAHVGLAGLVALDPLAYGDDVDRIEVIEGPSATTGHVVARLDAPESELASQDRGVRATAPPIALSGHGFGEARTLHIRALTRDGRGGTLTTFTSIRPMPPGFEAIEIASVVGSTRNNVPAPASTDGYQIVATDGIRLKAVPLSQDATDANWGTLGATLHDVPSLARYIPEAVVETDEVDVGAEGPSGVGHKMVFVLDCWADQRRKNATAPNITSREAHFPSAPQLHPGLEGSPVSPAWLATEILSDGTPRNPSPPPYFEVKWGDSSPISMAYQPYVPGLMIAARYVQVRLTIRDPIGMFQAIVPRMYVRALLPRRTVAGSDMATGSVATKTVTLATDPITGVSPFQNEMVVMVTSRTQDHTVYVTTKTPGTPSFVVTHRDAAATPGTNTDFDYLVTGY